jgi:hypothetical protein
MEREQPLGLSAVMAIGLLFPEPQDLLGVFALGYSRDPRSFLLFPA